MSPVEEYWPAHMARPDVDLTGSHEYRPVFPKVEGEEVIGLKVTGVPVESPSAPGHLGAGGVGSPRENWPPHVEAPGGTLAPHELGIRTSGHYGHATGHGAEVHFGFGADLRRAFDRAAARALGDRGPAFLGELEDIETRCQELLHDSARKLYLDVNDAYRRFKIPFETAGFRLPDMPNFEDFGKLRAWLDKVLEEAEKAMADMLTQGHLGRSVAAEMGKALCEFNQRLIRAREKYDGRNEDARDQRRAERSRAYRKYSQ